MGVCSPCRPGVVEVRQPPSASRADRIGGTVDGEAKSAGRVAALAEPAVGSDRAGTSHKGTADARAVAVGLHFIAVRYHMCCLRRIDDHRFLGGLLVLYSPVYCLAGWRRSSDLVDCADWDNWRAGSHSNRGV